MSKVIITHTDLDGLASAALIIKYLGEFPSKLIFIQPHQLHNVLRGIANGSDVFISDLGSNPSNIDKVVAEIKRIIDSGGSVTWFDHHIWEYSWIRTVLDAGAKLYVRNDTCGAGVVAKYLGINDEASQTLVKASCSADLWRFDHWLGNFLVRYAGFKGGRKWREHVVKKLVSFRGELDEEILRAAEDAVDLELKVFNKALRSARVVEKNGVRIVYYFKSDEEHLTSYVANLLMSRFKADMAVICRRRSVSLRSRRLNVRDIAKALGGGGHPQASGAHIKPPLVLRLLTALGIKRFQLNWCVNRVLEVIDSVRVEEIMQ